MEDLKVGDMVVWYSQAGGHPTGKKGSVLVVVPAGTDPVTLIPDGYKAKLPLGNARKHTSYLISIGGPVLRWPQVGCLRKMTEAEKKNPNFQPTITKEEWINLRARKPTKAKKPKPDNIVSMPATEPVKPEDPVPAAPVPSASGMSS